MEASTANLTEGPPEQPEFLTPQEVAELLRVSVYTVRRWIKEGDLPAYKVGRSWRIDQEELERWLDAQRQGSSG